MTLIKDITIVTMNPDREIITNGAIRIEGSKIVAIDKSENFPESPASINGGGMVALPGLIDTHAHADQSLLRGLGDQMHWVPFLDKIVDPYLSERSIHHSVLANQLSMIEMIKGGTTCFLSPNADPTDDFNLLSEASSNIGIRAIFCRFTTAKEKTRAWVNNLNDLNQRKNKLVDVWVGLDIPRVQGDTAHPDFYRDVRHVCERLGTGLAYHFCSEFEDSVYMYNEFGKTAAEWSRDNGILGPNVVLINGCQLTAGDIKILKETGTHLSHSPVANMKMATGILPASDVLHAGVNLALGTDGALNNNTYDMFAEMKAACLLQNSSKRSARALRPEHALEMATVNGAKAVGKTDLGSIEVGKEADIILVDMMNPRTRPQHDVASNLVFSASASQVRHVFVAGKHVLNNYQLEGVSELEIMRKVDSAADEIREIAAETNTPLWPMR